MIPTSSGAPAANSRRNRRHAAPVVHRPREHSRQHVGADRVELELERRDDPEVAAAAPETPEQVGVLLLARDHELAVGGDDVARAQVVDREAVLPHQVADAAAERETSDAGVADDPAGDAKPEHLALAVDVVVEATALDADGLGERVDARPGHE